ncbi:MAG: entericidin A/B family lipoprotein [Pseudomonadota bacterium]
MKAIFALLFALPLLAACNTIAGVGEDVEAAGKVVKETAEDVQEDLRD